MIVGHIHDANVPSSLLVVALGGYMWRDAVPCEWISLIHRVHPIFFLFFGHQHSIIGFQVRRAHAVKLLLQCGDLGCLFNCD